MTKAYEALFANNTQRPAVDEQGNVLTHPGPRKLDKLDRLETPKSDRCCDDNNSGIRL